MNDRGIYTVLSYKMDTYIMCLQARSNGRIHCMDNQDSPVRASVPSAKCTVAYFDGLVILGELQYLLVFAASKGQALLEC